MILSDKDIRAALASGELQLEPAPQAQHIQPASIDAHIDLSGGALLPVPGCVVDFTAQGIKGARYTKTAAGEPVVLAPGECALIALRERVKIPAHLALQVDGRSSTGRLFVTTHVTAGWCDPGFEGQITLEVVNQGPFTVRLHDGARVAQIKVCQLSSPARAPYGSQGRGSHYQGQQGATAPAQEEA